MRDNHLFVAESTNNIYINIYIKLITAEPQGVECDYCICIKTGGADSLYGILRVYV